MAEENGADFDAVLSDNDRIDAALKRAAREAALTHARLGRPLPQWRDGKVVWVTPEEIFTRYGLDANGKPLANGRAEG